MNVLDDSLGRVRAITGRSLEGRRFTLVASHFVLAMRGLEAARLLLASNRQVLAGIGQGHGLVGRFHMDHPKHKRGTLRPGRLTRLTTHTVAWPHLLPWLDVFVFRQYDSLGRRDERSPIDSIMPAMLHAVVIK